MELFHTKEMIFRRISAITVLTYFGKVWGRGGGARKQERLAYSMMEKTVVIHKQHI